MLNCIFWWNASLPLVGNKIQTLIGLNADRCLTKIELCSSSVHILSNQTFFAMPLSRKVQNLSNAVYQKAQKIGDLLKDLRPKAEGGIENWAIMTKTRNCAGLGQGIWTKGILLKISLTYCLFTCGKAIRSMTYNSPSPPSLCINQIGQVGASKDLATWNWSHWLKFWPKRLFWGCLRDW